MPKNNLKATLIRYAHVEGEGWRRGNIITSRNGRVKADAMPGHGGGLRLKPEARSRASEL
jgi:hypothetical protein